MRLIVTMILHASLKKNRKKIVPNLKIAVVFNLKGCTAHALPYYYDRQITMVTMSGYLSDFSYFCYLVA